MDLFEKILNNFQPYLLLRKASSEMFDRVLKTPLEYFHFVYTV